MNPQDVINDLCCLTPCKYISKDKSGNWFAWEKCPTIMPQSQGWFAPGYYILIKPGLIESTDKWSDSLYSADEAA